MEIIQQLEPRVKKLFAEDSSGHDIYHLRRTMNNALAIQQKEGGDRLIIAVSAFLHDVHMIIEHQTGKYCSPAQCIPKIKELLEKTGLTQEQKENIFHCIRYHEEYDFSENGKTVKDKETLIVQDADNLDAMGAIGIGRTFAYSGSMGIPMWMPEKPMKRETFDENKRDHSTMHHFESKLLKLKNNMNTETAKKMAEHRHKVMEEFVQEFFEEWEGKK